MNIDDRTKLLLGEKFDNLKDKKICVIGLGGVGSIIPISFVRTGIKNLIIIDKDKVDASNLNRQLAYQVEDIGFNKAESLKKHLLSIQDDVKIKELACCIDENFDFSIFEGCDYIIDAIDDINAKILIAKESMKRNIPFITSLGMGNRIDPSKVCITKLNKTTGDPLAKKFRYLLKKEGVDISNIDVAFSTEEPVIKERVISSIVFVPNACGLNIASYVLKKLVSW